MYIRVRVGARMTCDILYVNINKRRYDTTRKIKNEILYNTCVCTCVC